MLALGQANFSLVRVAVLPVKDGDVSHKSGKLALRPVGNLDGQLFPLLLEIDKLDLTDGPRPDVGVVFHQAAMVGVGQSMYRVADYVEANSLGTAVLLEAMIDRSGQIRRGC